MDEPRYSGTPRVEAAGAARADRNGWRGGLPVLEGEHVVLREVDVADARSLAALLTTGEVARFIWEPPATAEAFGEFIARTREWRAQGVSVCFAVTLKGFDTAIGIVQFRATAPDFRQAEWGFAIGSAFWGAGIFGECAALVLPFAFDVLGVHRLEARVAVRNGRGQGALRKLGAVHEGVLRQSFLCRGEYLDEALYTILGREWRASRLAAAPATMRQVH